MTEFATMDAMPREPGGKGRARALRREGRTPAIVYGGDGKPLSVSVDNGTLLSEVSRAGFFARLYDLKVDSDIVRVLAREVQVDPVTDIPIHVDFIRYVKGSTLAIFVAVRFEGQEDSEGLKRGGVLNIVRREVELLCPIEAIPEFITANVAGLEIGDSVHISDITLPDGVTATIKDRDFTIATIAAPTIVAEEEAEDSEEDVELEGEEGTEETSDEGDDDTSEGSGEAS